MSLRLRYTALSDVGRVRRDNQDSGYAGAHLLVIADGVGGAARGDVASSAAIAVLRKLDEPPAENALGALAANIHLTHDRLADLVEEHPELDGTSTTVTAGVFDGDALHVGHVGDSRAYLLRDGELEALTSDHTLVQSLVDEGRITEQEARVHPHRNLILKAVDGHRDPEPDLFSVPLRPGDRLLLCSDGCSGSVDPSELATLLGDGAVGDAAHALVRAALDGGSTDNVTVVIAEVVEEEAAGEVAPVVVGAAAVAPHLQLGSPATGNLTDGDVADLAAEPGPDPEELRYAPRPPRRFLWLRRLAVTLVILAVAAVAGRAAYDWSQGQYYVSDESGEVVIYRGVQADLPGITTHTIAERTGIVLDTLEPFDARQVSDGITAGSLAEARRIVSSLRLACPTPAPATTLRPKVTRTPTATASPRPSRSRTTSPAPTPSPTGTATSGPTVADDCDPAP